MSTPRAQTQIPPIKNFLETVLGSTGAGSSRQQVAFASALERKLSHKQLKQKNISAFRWKVAYHE